MMATLSIDLDNVIRDQIGSVIEATQRRYGVLLSREMFDRWDPPLGRLVGVPDAEFTAWAWSCPMIFAQARPMPGVACALAGLIEQHRVVIATATAYPELTEPWLRWWHVPYSDVVHTRNKAAVAFDLHIDDSPGTLRALASAGRRVVRFAQPWNADVTGLPALGSWADRLPVYTEQERE
jgi:5'(3')-deoxyribonucleotidase